MKKINQDTPEKSPESLKPLYGSRGNPPYYDPNDLHTHVWKKGKLGIEDNPKIPTYAKGKLNIKNCVYCKICHMIQDSFQSSVGKHKDIVTDIIRVVDNDSNNSNYKIIEPTEVDYVPEINTCEKNEKIFNYSINEKLFHQKEGIFDNYVIVENIE